MQKYLILLQALIALPQCWQPRATNTASAQSAGSAGARVDAANVSSADILLQQKHVSEDGSDFERLLTQRLQQEAAAGVAPAECLLSRKRRYLIFPEGSSFQLVYDGIYGIVDYTNYLILGITVALAWELPSKPQSEVIEQIADRLRDGSLGRRRNDSASKIVYVDTKKKPTTGRPTYISLAAGNTAATKAAYNYYYTNNNRRLLPLFQPPMHKKYYYYSGNNNNNNHNFGAYKRPIDSYYRQPPASTAAKYGHYRERPGDWRRKDGHYYYHYTPKAHPFAKWTQRRPPYGYTPKLTAATAGGNAGNNVKYPWWNLASRLSSSLRKKPIPARRIDSARTQQQQQQRHQQQQQQQHSTSGYYHQQPRLTTTTAATRKHRIYPVFGKRSIPDATPHRTHTGTNTTASMQQQQQQQQRQHRRQRRSGIARPEPELSPIERIHIRHHRSTRQSLYEKIEKYLDKLGIAHSHQCVLRALCETGQKSAERTPGTFVGELMRAVFTLPEALDEDVLAQRVHYKDQRYDAANAFSGDCAARFDLCKGSLWQSQFVA